MNVCLENQQCCGLTNGIGEAPETVQIRSLGAREIHEEVHVQRIVSGWFH